MSNNKNDNKKFWKSLNEYYDDPVVLEKKAHEFNQGVTDEFHPAEMNNVSRRKFLALISASAAFAVTSCTDYRDKGEIVPYNHRPEGMLPGKPEYYASTCSGCSEACGILVKTREGRPIKIDGNPDHPVNKGKVCAKGQASILNLYDPDRLGTPLKDGKKTSWDDGQKAVFSALNKAAKENKEIAVVTGPLYSPTEAKLLKEFTEKYPSTKIYSYDFFHSRNREDAWKLTYGSSAIPAIKWENAKVILSIDADFLSREGSHIEATRKYAERRDVMKGTGDFNRVYIAEGGMSLTGMNADYRISVRPDMQYDFVMSLMNEVAGGAAGYSLSMFAGENNLNKEALENLLRDLKQSRGESIVYAGDTLPVNVHAAVNRLNEALGNNGMYDWESTSGAQVPSASLGDIKKFINNLKNGNVGVVIHYDTNPVYHFPKSLGYGEALKKAGTVVSLTEYYHETAEAGSYTLPIHNELESWGDVLRRSNVYSLRQPIISPLYNSRQKEAVMLAWIGDEEYSEGLYHEYLMNNFRDAVYSKVDTPVDYKRFWFSALHDGVVEINAGKIESVFNAESSVEATEMKNGKTGEYVLHLQSNYFIGDGKFSNNGWLQELPHPVSKVTWDNYAAVSPATAKELSVENNDMIKIKAGGTELELPVLLQPGQAHKTIVVELGYGRTAAGAVGNGVGFNVNDLLGIEGNSFQYIISGVSVSKTGNSYSLVSTQEHHSLDEENIKDLHYKRKIIQEGTVKQYEKHHDFLHEPKHFAPNIATSPLKFEEQKWAMAIDLNKCTSCSACVTACSVENNIPVVGKDQVAVGREMQWIRLDRYYSGTPDEPRVSHQPMLCQQCDNAPCENVCPVNATNHSKDGINQMVYNRCVGTRYCANNCPYKVRRFNFFNFRDHFADAYYENDVTALVNNPEVTVRSRGVMEKCTFCIQNIMEERENAIREKRDIDGDKVKTACQVACPADAIVFGDANKKGSKIAKYREHELGYYVLESLNVRPNVTYIAKLRNTHSEEV